MQSLGPLLRAHRERSGLSQMQVHQRTGITQGHISALERETRNPSIEVLGRLAGCYGLDDETRRELLDAAVARVMSPDGTEASTEIPS